jgi:hypothetical protein
MAVGSEVIGERHTRTDRQADWRSQGFLSVCEGKQVKNATLQNKTGNNKMGPGSSPDYTPNAK